MQSRPLTSRKLDGILSLLWAGFGYLVLHYGHVQVRSQVLGIFLVLGLWWGVAVLLAISGLRSRSRVSSLMATGTLLLCFYFLFSLPPKFTKPPRSRISVAQDQLRTFETALEAFHVDYGYYPPGTNGLQALLEPPEPKLWHGPYLEAIPKDPWGNAYLYQCPGRHHTNAYDLISRGPPKQNKPIVNWDMMR
jgi:general secretion pathway protein G